MLSDYLNNFFPLGVHGRTNANGTVCALVCHGYPSSPGHVRSCASDSRGWHGGRAFVVHREPASQTPVLHPSPLHFTPPHTAVSAVPPPAASAGPSPPGPHTSSYSHPRTTSPAPDLPSPAPAGAATAAARAGNPGMEACHEHL